LLPPAPYYERPAEFIRQGDVGFFPFAQLLKTDEDGRLPGGTPPPTMEGIPAFDGMTEATVTFDGSEYLMRRWHGLGVVIDMTSELMKRPENSRVTVVPLVPKEAVKVNWGLAMAGRLAGVLPIPAVEQGTIDTDLPDSDMPDVLLSARSITTVSRGIVIEGRMMSLTPRMVAVLVSKLGEHFGNRAWSRMTHLGNVVGQRLERVDDIESGKPVPTAGRWAVMTFENGERMHVFVDPAI
jgi:hypothetical protein